MGRASLLAATVMLLVGCGGAGTTSTRPPTSKGTSHASAAQRPASTGTGTARKAPPPPLATVPDPQLPSPGSLPQTSALPSADTAGFHAEMTALWQGIRTNSPAQAMTAFFPEGAYVQLKTIGDPSGDFTGRLVRDFALDIGAANQLLGPGAAGARLLSVDVPSEYAHWVPPGVCDNGVGYYEVPNSRVVYQENGGTSSFGIASMISWRGVWYVVHLGTILRATDTGVVDDPTSGSGYSVPSSIC